MITGRLDMTGTVKSFNESKGFGWITPDDGGDDVFVHFSQIMTQTLTTLLEGQKVSFTVADGPTGKQATGIKAL
jgi:CspA family cold shock protein